MQKGLNRPADRGEVRVGWGEDEERFIKTSLLLTGDLGHAQVRPNGVPIS